MNYSDPKLRDLLAGVYALGLMPTRARARFERLMAADAGLERLVADWTERLAPIDASAAPVTPSPRIWRAIERETQLRAAPSSRVVRTGFFESLAFWRGFGLAAAAVAAALVVYVAVGPGPAREPTVVAVLADSAGTPAFIATQATRADDVAVTPVRAQSIEAQKSFQLWAIAGGPPKPLGLLSATPGRRLLVPASAVAAGAVLAISLEPEGGSPTGLPTGPVLFQGKVLVQSN
jgi:anti-sigma-K factor RskA